MQNPGPCQPNPYDYVTVSFCSMPRHTTSPQLLFVMSTSIHIFHVQSNETISCARSVGALSPPEQEEGGPIIVLFYLFLRT